MAEGLVLVGGGRMGAALLEGWLKRDNPFGPPRVIEPDPARMAALRALGDVQVVARPQDLEGPAACIVVAVKPQMMAEVLPELTGLVGQDSLVISIAAGTLIARFEAAFGAKTAIVRAMPNTPAAVGAGMSVLCVNANVRPEQRDQATRLLEAVGAVDWIEDERHMHAVTALSGSGPAYVFAFVEALIKAGIEAGLPEALATRLARQTVFGAAQLLQADASPAAELRRNVTSPGGTTAAGLEPLLAADGLDPLLAAAVRAAVKRSEELG